MCVHPGKSGLVYVVVTASTPHLRNHMWADSHSISTQLEGLFADTLVIPPHKNRHPVNG